MLSYDAATDTIQELGGGGKKTFFRCGDTELLGETRKVYIDKNQGVCHLTMRGFEVGITLDVNTVREIVSDDSFSDEYRKYMAGIIKAIDSSSMFIDGDPNEKL